MHRVVIVGGGFGGLYCAKSLRRNKGVEVVVVDRRNFHLFQPLLYQVATGGLSPGDIASPLRAVLKRHKNATVLQGEVVDVLPQERKVILGDGELSYDTLVIATGMRHHYFGRDEWAARAPGLKSVEDALEMRRRIFQAFERAEREENEERRRALLRFVVIGGGPTGVELAGALAELAHSTLKGEFRRIDSRQSEILLVENGQRVLAAYPPSLSARAEKSLRRLGVRVELGTMVQDIEGQRLVLKRGERQEEIEAGTVLWAAGMRATALGQVLAQRSGAECDRAGRIVVEPDLSIAAFPEICVVGDMALFTHQGERPLPGVAPVAMQQGRYVARRIEGKIKGTDMAPFHYVDRGSLAVIGRHAGVADLGFLKFWGWPAWLVWLFVHIAYLIEFDNKILVLTQWAWNYWTRKRGARLITESPQE